MFEPSERAKEAESILTEDSFSPDEAKEKLTGLSKDELTWLSQSFMQYAHNLFYWHDELDSSLHPENDAYIESVAVDLEKRLCFLVDAGLDPNHVVDEENPIWNFQYIADERYLNARLLRILLEHGGNPNINPDEDEWNVLNIYEYVDVGIIHDEESRDCYIPYLMMLAAYGGKTKTGDNFFHMLGEHKIEEFKEIEKLAWTCDSSTVEHKEEKTAVTHVEIHIYNRETKEEIAYYE